MEIRNISRLRLRSADCAQLDHFAVDGKEMYKIYNARAQPLIFLVSLNRIGKTMKALLMKA